MRLINDDQIPPGRNKVFETLAVVAGELLLAPATAGVHWLDGIEWTDDLVVRPPEVLVVIDRAGLPQSGQAARQDEPKVLIEVCFHFGLPLQHQSGGRYDENPAGKAANFEL